jgi:glucose 1-dehydrogenase
MRSPNQEVPNAGGADYDCSKGVLGNLTHVLALELAPLRINVNNLGPGMVLTPINQPAIDDPEPLDEQVQSIPLKRRPNRQISPAWPCSSRRRTATT